MTKTNEEVITIFLPPNTYRRIEAFAEANLISVSEAIREFMKAFVKSKKPVKRRRSTRRVNLWISSEEYARFTTARRARKATVAEAIEAAMGEEA